MRTASAVARSLRDPLRGSMVAAVAMIACGFAAMAAGWNGAATTFDVAEQVTYVLSAGFTGVGLVAVGLTVLLVQRTRRTAAVEQGVLSRLVAAVATANTDHEGSRP